MPRGRREGREGRGRRERWQKRSGDHHKERVIKGGSGGRAAWILSLSSALPLPLFVVMAKAKKESSDGDRTVRNSSDQAVVVKPCDGDATAKIEWYRDNIYCSIST